MMRKPSKTMNAVMLLVGLVVARPALAQWNYLDNNADIRALCEVGDTLWVGTNGGIVLIDLLTDEVVRKMTAGERLPDNSVRVIVEYGGEIYVGTDGGLAVFSPGRNRVYTPRQGSVFSDIRSLGFGADGEVYMGTYGHGVGVYHHNKLRTITTADSLLDNKVFGVAVQGESRLYFATAAGFCAYRDSAWVGFQAGAGLARGQVTSLLPIGDNRFYLLVAGRGIFRFRERRAVRVRLRDTFARNEVSAIAVDSEKALWAAGRFGGIARYKNGRWTRYGDDDPVVASSRWHSAHAGENGVVYFGSGDGIIAVVRDGRVSKIEVPSSLPSGYVGAMAVGRDGRVYLVNGRYVVATSAGSGGVLSREIEIGSMFDIGVAPGGEVWVSTPFGLLHRQNDRWIEILPEIEPHSPLFVAFAFDSTGALWAGSNTGEVYRFDGSLWVRYADRHALSGPIHNMTVDGGGRPWVASRTAVHQYDGVGWRTFGAGEFDSLQLRDVEVDGAGRPVVLTEGALWRFGNDEMWRRLDVPEIGPAVRCNVFCFDDRGRLYLGTTNGLVLIGGDEPRWLDTRGLRGRDVTGLTIGQDNTLWVGFRGDGVSWISLEKLW